MGNGAPCDLPLFPHVGCRRAIFSYSFPLPSVAHPNGKEESSQGKGGGQVVPRLFSFLGSFLFPGWRCAGERPVFPPVFSFFLSLSPGLRWLRKRRHATVGSPCRRKREEKPGGKETSEAPRESERQGVLVSFPCRFAVFLGGLATFPPGHYFPPLRSGARTAGVGGPLLFPQYISCTRKRDPDYQTEP